ncbi:hypothetical protein HJFPF1_11567 [Paramyrothecium foliicola]|nr:hypothetical protein HJFPF1_11567 [Paramyrothecium foliicola]
MSVMRTSQMAIRAGLRSARAPLVRPVQTRFLTHDKNTNDLGGPYGQTPPPQNPGGVDAIRRNRMRAAGGVLLFLGLVAYMAKEPEKSQKKVEQGKQAVGLKS